MMESSGKKFRNLVNETKPLQIVGTVNAYSAIMAEKVGHQSIYLSGGGVAASSLGVPDLGITSLADVLEDAKRITQVTSLPLLVDADTGWGGAFNIARCVQEMIKSNVAAIHIEDQVSQKRCGHRPNKSIVSTNEMIDRIKAAVDAKTDSDFVIMARTDALAIEGMQSAIEKAQAFAEAGADMIFPEALNSIEQYREFSDSLSVPILANITEFGQTPLFSKDELLDAGVGGECVTIVTDCSAICSNLKTSLISPNEKFCILYLLTYSCAAEFVFVPSFPSTLDV